MRVQYPTTKTPSYSQIGASRKETLVPAHPSDLHSSEWDATGYHRLSDPQFSWGQKVLTRLKLQGDELVLDAGCGSGRLSRSARRVCSAVPPPAYLSISATCCVIYWAYRAAKWRLAPILTHNDSRSCI